MSSYPEATPSSLPPITQEPWSTEYEPEQKEQKETPERRSTSARDQLNRRIFDQTYRLIKRYSFSPLKKDTYGSYLMPNDEVRNFLYAETEELKHKDPLIQLRTLQHQGKIDVQNHDIRTGVYRLVNPSIKQLNDLYLGPNQTDDFIFEDLNKAITEHLGKNSGHLLHANFKGGVFVMDFTELANGSGRAPEEVLHQRVAEIHEMAKTILLKHVGLRLKLLESKKATLEESLVDGSLKTKKQVNTCMENLKKNREKTDMLTALRWRIETGEETIDIAFGFDRVGHGIQNQYRAIHNAELAANMATIDAQENGHRAPRQFDYKDLAIGAIQTLRLLGSFGIVDENGVKEEWEPFFTLDDAGYIRMQPEMIKIYRRLDKYRVSSEYLNMNSDEQLDFNRKIELFGQYYTRINMVDVLKKFRYPNMDQYLERIEQITTLIAEAEKALEGDHYGFHSQEHMRSLLEKTSHELEVSLKDDGEELVRTTRAAIKALMQPGLKMILYTDNIGFGAINQSSYEQSVLDLVDALQISNEEWDTVNDSQEKLEALVEYKLKTCKDDPEFQRILLSIGDVGTSRLRDNEKTVISYFGGKGIVNADGGDETRIYLHLDDNPKIPTGENVLSKDLLGISIKTNMRIAAVVTDRSFSPIRDPRARLVPQDEQRKQIGDHVQETVWAEDSHETIKDLNALGDHMIKLRKEQSQKRLAFL